MKDRLPLMAANWKMNLSLDEAEALLAGIKEGDIDFDKVNVLVAPPFTTLQLAKEILAGTEIFIAGQNMHWEKEGAFTGEISSLMLKEAGCSHIILGHSERRSLFGETDEIINKKVEAAVEAGLVPVVCIGETLQDREDQKTFDVLGIQLNGSLKSSCRRGKLPDRVMLAYEPVWAIGTGKTATSEQAQEVHRFVRQWLKENFGNDSSETVRVLYGGSVKPDNINELMSQPDVDGALIGGASLKAESFLSIIRYYKS